MELGEFRLLLLGSWRFDVTVRSTPCPFATCSFGMAASTATQGWKFGIVHLSIRTASLATGGRPGIWKRCVLLVHRRSALQGIRRREWIRQPRCVLLALHITSVERSDGLMAPRPTVAMMLALVGGLHSIAVTSGSGAGLGGPSAGEISLPLAIVSGGMRAGKELTTIGMEHIVQPHRAELRREGQEVMHWLVGRDLLGAGEFGLSAVGKLLARGLPHLVGHLLVARRMMVLERHTGIGVHRAGRGGRLIASVSRDP